MPRSSFGPYGWPEHRDEQPVRVLRIDFDVRNLLRVAQAADASTSCRRRSTCRCRRRPRGPAAAALRRCRRRSMLGSDGATTTEPIDPVGWSSKIGFQVRPASVVFHTPPFTCRCRTCTAGWHAGGRLGAARRAVGPMLRHRISPNRLGIDAERLLRRHGRGRSGDEQADEQEHEGATRHDDLQVDMSIGASKPPDL